jgi:hypothetical protein
LLGGPNIYNQNFSSSFSLLRISHNLNIESCVQQCFFFPLDLICISIYNCISLTHFPYYSGRPAHLPEETHDPDVEDNNSSDGNEDEPSVIVQLSNRVQDGTRCRPGSLDMCIQGKCQVGGCVMMGG